MWEKQKEEEEKKKADLNNNALWMKSDLLWHGEIVALLLISQVDQNSKQSMTVTTVSKMVGQRLKEANFEEKHTEVKRFGLSDENN